MSDVPISSALFAGQRRWLTRREVVSAYPIRYGTIAKLPQNVLPFTRVGKSCVYDVLDVDAFFERLKKSPDGLAGLLRDSAQPALTARRRGRPRKAGLRRPRPGMGDAP